MNLQDFPSIILVIITLACGSTASNSYTVWALEGSSQSEQYIHAISTAFLDTYEDYWVVKCSAELDGNSGLFSSTKPIHATPVPLLKLRIDTTVFETVLKVVDLITPYKKDGKIGLFGELGLGKL